jgi:hypothetical protein
MEDEARYVTVPAEGSEITWIPGWLPVFPGFYSTIFEFDEQASADVLDDLLPENLRGGPMLDVLARLVEPKVRYREWMVDFSKKMVKAVHGHVRKPGLIPELHVAYEQLTSPREYNFHNDAINVQYGSDDWDMVRCRILLLLGRYHKEWEEYLRRYISCSGFISSYPHTPWEWFLETDRYRALERHYLGAVLQFLLGLGEFELTEDDLNEARPGEWEYVDPVDVPAGAEKKIGALLKKMEKDMAAADKQFKAYAEAMNASGTEWDSGAKCRGHVAAKRKWMDEAGSRIKELLE